MWIDKTRHQGIPEFVAAFPAYTAVTRTMRYWWHRWHLDSDSASRMRNVSFTEDRLKEY